MRAYFNEKPELWIMFQLLFHPLLGQWMMSNIYGVYNSELRCRIQEDITDSLDDRMLFSLTNVQDFEQSTIGFTKLENVSEDFKHKFFEDERSHHGGIGISKRFHEDVLDDIQILNVLLLFADELVDNPAVPCKCIGYRIAGRQRTYVCLLISFSVIDASTCCGTFFDHSSRMEPVGVSILSGSCRIPCKKLLII